MQVKKFEAPTLQEALEAIKRELGPEAIILQTKQNRKGFGLLSKSSVEVTAAVSERSFVKKSVTEKRVPEVKQEALRKLPATEQANFYDGYFDTQLDRVANKTKDRVQLSASPESAPTKKLTAVRYSDIPDVVSSQASQKPSKSAAKQSVQQVSATPAVAAPVRAPKIQISESDLIDMSPSPGGLMDQLREPQVTHQHTENHHDLKAEVARLKALVEKNMGPHGGVSPGWSHAIQEAFESLVFSGIERNSAFKLMKEVEFELPEFDRVNLDRVLDQVAHELLKRVQVLDPDQPSTVRQIQAFVGPSGVGKTTLCAKIAGRMVREQKQKVGWISIEKGEGETYARLLNLPYRLVRTPAEMQAALGDFQNLHAVVIDCPGVSRVDQTAFQSLQEILSSIQNVRVELVLSGVTRDQEACAAAKRFNDLHPEALCVTRMDETLSFGSILNWSEKFKWPLLYFSTGNRFPEDLEKATPERLVGLMMGL